MDNPHAAHTSPASSSNFLEVPGPDPATEAAKRAELRRYKAIATGLLVFATLIYISMRYLEYQGNAGAWIGYVRAGAEAGMIGALADWFAVVALFRHPMRIPIPHTAIIKKKKDQVGQALSEFVGENFLNAALISDKLAKANIPQRAAEWVLTNEGDQRVSKEAGKLITLTVNGIDPLEAEQVLKALVFDQAAEPQWAPPLGRGLQQLIDEGRTEPAVEAVVVWLDDKARTSEDFVVSLIDERTPAWAPRFVRELVGDKVYRELTAFTADVRRNKNHEARHQIRTFIAQMAHDLQHDPAMIKRVEGFKQDIMSSGPIQALPGRLWDTARVTLTTMAEDPDSILRQRIASWTAAFAHRIQDEPELRRNLDNRIVRAASYLADNYAGEVTSIIGETVERWDAQEASERIELLVGKDLQFIRFNGTVVGAIAGVVIYSLTELIFALA
ncbi:MAG TPA: DUF445 family protein [Candidatus Corynebacterium gallistercoris]|uniref:DUF445 family protein n=1 Tax=Candidatus Corynebacterium gallistercoris TaxID=2838530 RepID=A0A9D1UQU6_9CORY|nr:DUF445 family protein [Candidatus Corynebacterium gallistercoris]